MRKKVLIKVHYFNELIGDTITEVVTTNDIKYSILKLLKDTPLESIRIRDIKYNEELIFNDIKVTFEVHELIKIYDLDLMDSKIKNLISSGYNVIRRNLSDKEVLVFWGNPTEYSVLEITSLFLSDVMITIIVSNDYSKIETIGINNNINTFKAGRYYLVSTSLKSLFNNSYLKRFNVQLNIRNIKAKWNNLAVKDNHVQYKNEIDDLINKSRLYYDTETMDRIMTDYAEINTSLIKNGTDMVQFKDSLIRYK